MVLSSEEKFVCINEAVEAANLAEERMRQIWNEMKTIIKEKKRTKSGSEYDAVCQKISPQNMLASTSRSSVKSSPKSSSRSAKTTSLRTPNKLYLEESDSHLPSEPVIGETIRISTRCNNLPVIDSCYAPKVSNSSKRSSKKPKLSTRRSKTLEKTKYSVKQPYKLRKPAVDEGIKKIYGFGGYIVMPKPDETKFKSMESYKKTIARRYNLERFKRNYRKNEKTLLEQFAKLQVKENNVTEKVVNRAPSPMKPNSGSVIVVGSSRSTSGAHRSTLGLPQNNRFNRNSYRFSQSSRIDTTNSSESVSYMKRSNTTCLGDKIEALLSALLMDNKKASSKDLHDISGPMMRTVYKRGPCPAKSIDHTSRAYEYDESNKWSTPRPVPCTCFPSSRSSEVLENIASTRFSFRSHKKF